MRTEAMGREERESGFGCLKKGRAETLEKKIRKDLCVGGTPRKRKMISAVG